MKNPFSIVFIFLIPFRTYVIVFFMCLDLESVQVSSRRRDLDVAKFNIGIFM